MSDKSESSNGIWYALVAAGVVFIGAGLLSARSAEAAIAPDPNNPVPTPTPTRHTTATAPTFVRQGDPLVATSSSAIRVLQTQLNALGYHAGTPDGDFGPSTTAAAAAFVAANGLPGDTSDLSLMIIVDTQYAYFNDTRGGIRSS